MGSQRLRHGWRTARSHTKSRDWCPYRDVRVQGNTEGRCCHEDRDRVMLSEAEECQQPQGCGGETLEFSSLQVLANALISTLLFSRSEFIHSSASVILLLISSSVLFISVHLFFSFSRSLINISCIFSIFTSIFS